MRANRASLTAPRSAPRRSRPTLRASRQALVWLVLGFAACALAQPFFLPTGDEVYNTGDPRVRADAHGGLHLAYPLVAAAGAVYAYCPPGCGSAEEMWTVVFETGEAGAVGNALVALDGAGRPRLLLATHDSVFYAECSGDCRDDRAWSLANVYTHDGGWELTGEAFALDPDGHPRFLMHAEQTYLGLFAPDPGTLFFACDASCLDPASWRRGLISEQSWLEPTFVYDPSGVAHVAAVITVEGADLVAYLRCEADCGSEEVDNWPGIGLGHAFFDRYVEEIQPSVSLAVTAAGGARLAFLGQNDGERFLAYFECDADCTAAEGEAWTAIALVSGEPALRLGDGLQLVLTAAEHPRLVYTHGSNIYLGTCDNDCVGRSGSDDWGAVTVETGEDLPADDIFLYRGCNVGYWFFRQPAVAVTPVGEALIAYRAEDISAGWTPSAADPTVRGCAAGVDMTLGRLARVPGD
ncbi:MAG: hypothetical protein KIT12_01895 [Trueperaceae bacterium]|nr:hypothetical protein [Trueperaceae bacterium]